MTFVFVSCISVRKGSSDVVCYVRTCSEKVFPSPLGVRVKFRVRVSFNSLKKGTKHLRRA